MAQGALCSEQFLKLNSEEESVTFIKPYTLKVGDLSRPLFANPITYRELFMHVNTLKSMELSNRESFPANGNYLVHPQNFSTSNDLQYMVCHILYIQAQL